MHEPIISSILRSSGGFLGLRRKSYESASQFSREYSRLYGMPPARDAARFRSPVVLGNNLIVIDSAAART